MDTEERKKDVLLRLKKIEGQVRGVQRMIEEGSPCSDILTQVAAVTAAAKRVGMGLVQGYMEECLGRVHVDPALSREEALKEFQKAVAQYFDWT
jgi:CsoR family transcriptional regulator, copper-sensing transcriptional repressor